MFIKIYEVQLAFYEGMDELNNQKPRSKASNG